MSRRLIRRASCTKPLCGVARIPGELPKLGSEVRQAKVGRHLPRCPKAPSPTWRSFLHNQLIDTVGDRFFLVATTTFRIRPHPP